MFPVSGAFAVFGTRFVSPALGFTLGGFSCALRLIHLMFCLDRVELLAAMVTCWSVVHTTLIYLTRPVFSGVFQFVRRLYLKRYGLLVLPLASELTAAAVILGYWSPLLQPWHWAIIIIVPIFFLQLIHVRVYGTFLFGLTPYLLIYHVTGESEYWLSMIKVVMIVLFIIVGLIYDWGGIKHHPGPVSPSLP